MSAHARAPLWLPFTFVALVIVGCSSSTPRDQNWGSNVGRGDASPSEPSASDGASPGASAADAAVDQELSEAGDNPALDAGSADTILLDATEDQDPADVTNVSQSN